MMERNDLEYLKSKLRKAQIILFTGAGFSVGLKSKSGFSLPIGSEITKELWKYVYPGEAFEENTQLKDIFPLAEAKGGNRLKEILISHFDIQKSSLTEAHNNLSRIPFKKLYTINIDNFADVAPRMSERQFKCYKYSDSIDASSPKTVPYVYLNGSLEDIPDKVIFSRSQFAKLDLLEYSAYNSFVSDLYNNCIIFIGSELEEGQFWTHIERRELVKSESLKPKSFIVSKSLPRAKIDLLKKMNIIYIKGTYDEFMSYLIKECPNELCEGVEFLNKSIDYSPSITSLDSIQITKTLQSNYLKGCEPRWADIDSGFTIQRAVEIKITSSLQTNQVILINGTAGSGKSSLLMRISRILSANTSENVFWVNSEQYFDKAEIDELLNKSNSNIVLVIDNITSYNQYSLSSLAECMYATNRLRIVASGRYRSLQKVTQVLNENHVHYDEIYIPNLEDSDIDPLLMLLEEKKALGVLSKYSIEDQRRKLVNEYGKQLIVAMIEATSGKRFDEKLQSELTDLEGRQKYLYSIICIVDSLRRRISRNELIRVGSSIPQGGIQAVNSLIESGLIVDDQSHIRSRHMVVSNKVYDYIVLNNNQDLKGFVLDIINAISPQLDVGKVKTSGYRLVSALYSHNYLKTSFTINDAMSIYELIEPLHDWDYSFWLQRAAFELEVENGNLEKAEVYLNRSNDLGSDDKLLYIETEYLKFKQSINAVERTLAEVLYNSAKNYGQDVINSYGHIEPRAYHIYLNCASKYIQKWIDNSIEKKNEFNRIYNSIYKQSILRFPTNQYLKNIGSEIERELLMTQVNANNVG